MIELIAALATNGCIGIDNSLPWSKLKGDMNFFRTTTTGKAIIMGRNTFESLNRTPLPNRLNIVISSKLDKIKGIEVVEDMEEALEVAHKNEMIPIIIGGGQIYREAIKVVDVMYLTMVKVEPEPEGDTFFPHVPFWNWNQEVIKMGEKDDNNDYRYTIYKFTKK